MTTLTSRWILALALLLVVCTASWSSYAQRQARAATSWEYRLVFIPEKDFGKTQGILNEQGADGWELVQKETWGQSGNLYYMKRMK
jgi:hypothetical protein